jgi:hypothetical protein
MLKNLKKGGIPMKITNLIAEMSKDLANIADDVYKFEINGNNLAGSRVRKVMQKIKMDAQDVRIAVQQVKKERKGN